VQGIDEAHASLIEGLVKAHKPKMILEVGYGAGVSHKAIMAGCKFNQNKPHYVLVDNWHDWNGQYPQEIRDQVRLHVNKDEPSLESFTTVCKTEEEYIKSTRDVFDFIMMDGDHQHSHEWALDVFYTKLNTPGILCYHDVDGAYPGLAGLPDQFAIHFVFNKSSKEGEECERGLLVVFKT
jgi:predicted O-methyltransferase YrrM